MFINRHIATGYEDYSENWQLFERIMLHEMVHWARFIAGSPGRTSSGGEAGSAFEEKAYGVKVRNHYDVACS